MQMFYGRQVENLGLVGKNFDRDLLLGACFSRIFHPIFAAGRTDVDRLVYGLGSSFVPLWVLLVEAIFVCLICFHSC